MSCASTQLYFRDVQMIRDMPICGNRSDVENWNVSQMHSRLRLDLVFVCLGLCLLPVYFIVSCSIDCYDRFVHRYYRYYLEKRFVES